MRNECCADLIAEKKAGGVTGDAVDCDYRGQPEGPGFHFVNLFAYDVNEWFAYLTKSWTIATQNSINYSQDETASKAYFKEHVFWTASGCARHRSFNDVEFEGYANEGIAECKEMAS